MATIDPKIQRPAAQLIDLVTARAQKDLSSGGAATAPDSETVTRSFQSLVHGGGASVHSDDIPSFGGVFGNRIPK